MCKKTIYLLRRIDYHLGKLLYIIFGLSGLFKNVRKNTNTVKKILLIRLWGLGNLTIIFPLIQKLKIKYPQASILFFTFDSNKGFLEKHQSIDRVIYFKFTTNIFAIIFRFIFIVTALRKEKIELLINFEEFNITAALFSYLTRSPIRIGIHNKYEKMFYTDYIVNDPKVHISHIFNNLIKLSGVKSPYSYLRFPELRNIKDKIEDNLRSRKIEQFICIHPGTSKNFTGKRWKPYNFSELSNMLIVKYNVSIVFTGMKEERDLIDDIIENIASAEKVFNLAGELDVWGLVELLRKAGLFISNDTGPVHIAASLGINLVVFYGPTTPSRYRPLNKNSLIFYNNLTCSPCINADYTGSQCRNNFECLNFFPQKVFLEISKKFFNGRERAASSKNIKYEI